MAAAGAVSASPRSSWPVLTAALAQSVGFAATGLQAQTATTDTKSSTKLDDVVVEGQKQAQVSSPKFTAPLVDTPQTLVVVPREVYSQQGAATLSDVLRNTPGITFLAGEGGNASSADGDSFFLRGFDATNSVFVDGVRDSGQYSRDVFNIEQVEIAKGPAGSDIGRTTAGGYVNLATKVARAEKFTQGTASYGTNDKVRATIDTNHPVNESTAVRVNAMVQNGGVAGRDVVEENRWAVSPSVTFGLGKPTRVSLAYQHLDYDDLPDYGITRAAVPGGGGYDPLPAPVDVETFYGAREDFDRVQNDAVTARIEHDVSSSIRLSNQTKLSHTDRKVFLTAPTTYTPATGLVTRSRQGNERENESISNLTNLQAAFDTGALKHQASVGLEYLWEKQEVTSYTSIAAATDAKLLTSLTNPVIDGDFVDPFPSGASSYGGIETVSVYAFDTVEITPKVEVTGGVRAEHFDGNYRSTATTGIATRGASDDTVASGKLGVVYKPTPASSVYAAWSTSTRPPGTNFTFSTNVTNADNLAADPQKATNYEVGTKWDFFNRRLSTAVALFQSKNENVSVATDSVTGLPIQNGDQKVQGVELSVSGRITDNWLVFGGFSYLDTENSNPTSGATNDNATLQWTPKVSGNLWTTYRLPFGVTIGGGAQYVDQVARQTTATPSATLPYVPSYWLVNAMASYTVNEHLTLRANVNNVFDEFYYQSVNNNGNRVNVGAPTSFLLSADVAF